MDNLAQLPMTPIAPSTGGGNKKIIKIAGIILGVVFLFVAAELVYYFYNTSKKSVDGSAAGEEQAAQETTAPGTSDISAKTADILSQIDYVASRGNYYKEATVKTVFEGRVTKPEAALAVENGLTTAYTIEIQNKDGDNLRIKLTQVERDKAKVRLLKPNGESQSITLEEIQVDDYVKITTIDNLLDPLVNSALITFDISRSQ